MNLFAGRMTFLLALGLAATPAKAAHAQNDTISLAGSWRFRLDRDDVGLDERWFTRKLPQQINLPGALQNQGFGNDVTPETKWTANINDRSWYTSPRFEKYRQPGNVKVPFWLQPAKHYVGAAWYQREIEIPAAWRGRRVVLELERPHWETRVWLNDRLVGTNDSLSTPHVYDLGTRLAPGRHTLTIRVDNRLIVDVGVWAHSVSDHTQGNWNGVVGRLELSATSPVWIEEAQVFPNVTKKSALLKVRIGNSTGTAGKGTLSVGTQSLPVKWETKDGAAETEVPLGDKAQLWDEFTPTLQRLTLALKGDSAEDQRVVSFGLRHISTEGSSFLINGRKTFFRGTLECCIFPLTGYPPTDVESWKRIIRICQAHGLNHIRFHSWCPPEASFVAADELGFYYQVEIAAWTTVGSGAPIDRWLYEEGERILRAYGNHPSFVLMPYGNEPNGPKYKEFLAQWVNYWKGRDARRLYTSASGWPSLAENEYHVTPAPRGPKGWIGEDYRNAIKNLSGPVIVHEMGQWCVYPNFEEIPKYTGPLKAKNFEIFRDSLAEHGMLDQWSDFVRASGKLQVLCYKEEIEAALRTPGISGVQLLDLHDFPGQGTALVGVLDAFWDSKGYITPAEFRRFYGRTVPLARMAQRVWKRDETFAAEVEVAHFGAAPLVNVATYWKLTDESGHAATQGEFPTKTIAVDRGVALGRIEVPLGKLAAPQKFKLVVGLKNTSFENDWTLWLYPPRTDRAAPSDVLVTTSLDDSTAERLAAGRKVLWLATNLPPEHPKGSFRPVFWNRQWFPSQSCQTLGLLCDPKHPALKEFPTDFHSDWQWEDIVKSSRAFVMDSLPSALRPIVQIIDDWNTNRKLGLVWECRVGAGKLLMVSADLEHDLDHRPAARQLRASLLGYVAGGEFRPKVEVSREQLALLIGGRQSGSLSPAAAPPRSEATSREEALILTPKPPRTPRINGAKIFGVRPGSPFLFTIPATGERPMNFAVENLPAGLKVDSRTGQITGALKERGEFVVTFKASNTLGTAERKFKIVCGDTLALTPHMGWNSWYVWENRVTDPIVRAAADAMVSSGMMDHGYQYVNIDDCWAVKPGATDRLLGGATRDAQGRVNANGRFPDMKALTDYIHAKGLKAGIYTSPGPTTCAGHVGAYQHEEQDVQRFVEWGFDFLKHDWCSYGNIAKNPDRAALQKPYRLVADILKRQPRDIVLNLCQYGMGNVWEWGKEVGGNSWRTAGDLGGSFKGIPTALFRDGFDVYARNELHKFGGPGAWNDPDYLLLGYLSNWKGGTAPTPLTPNEQYTHVSLWCLLAAPLIFSGDITRLDDFTLSLLCNDEVIEVDQDPLGKPGHRLSRDDNLEVWAKEMENGSRAVGLFNRGELETTVTARWADLAIHGKQIVHDLWRQKDLGEFDGRFETPVPQHGVVLVRLRPAQTRH